MQLKFTERILIQIHKIEFAFFRSIICSHQDKGKLLSMTLFWPRVLSKQFKLHARL